MIAENIFITQVNIDVLKPAEYNPRDAKSAG